MKISFLLPHIRISGGVKALLEYANRLQNLKHEVQVYLPALKAKWYQWVRKRHLSQRTVHALAPDTIDWFANQVPLNEVLSFDEWNLPDADILVASSWQTAQDSANLSLTKGCKFYFVQHYESLWSKPKHKADATYILPFQKIVISSWLQLILKEKFKQESQLLVTPVDRKQFDCDQKMWNRPPRVCLLHHDYDWKGYAEGIQAAREVREQNIDFQLVVFGEKLKDAKPLLDSAGFDFEYQYRLTGDGLRELFTSCDIYVCPSWYEGLGMPAMEAMACRCALVTTDTGGCRDYAIHDQTALVSPPRKVSVLAGNLSTVIQDLPLRQRLSENGFRKIQEFDWDTNCKKLEQLFEEGCERSTSGHSFDPSLNS